MRVVGDLESDGLLPTATTIWCGVFHEIDTGVTYVFPEEEVFMIPDFLDDVELLIGHNFIDYDIPLMECILDYTYTGEVFDTWIVSQMTKPDRFNGKHGLAAWGEHFGVPKPPIEDWSRYTPEMLHRCKEDVKINVLVYKQLMKELRYE